MSSHYLPLVGAPPTVAGEGTQDRARELFLLMAQHPEQRRKQLTWHDGMAKVAEARCWDMATRGYFSHVDMDGYGPNWWVRQSGYKLPTFYSQDRAANNIESIAAYGTPQDVWTVLLNSPGHRIHVLGLVDFYAAQTNVGIGHVHVEGSKWGHYYSILTAHSESVP